VAFDASGAAALLTSDAKATSIITATKRSQRSVIRPCKVIYEKSQ
jgi:hypothetical protein